MQIKRLLDDRVVVTGDKLINSQGEHCEFVEHANGQLVAVSPVLSVDLSFSSFFINDKVHKWLLIDSHIFVISPANSLSNIK